MKIQIKARFTRTVLFEHDAEDNSIRLTLTAAVSARANLSGADLSGANLSGANLPRANLSGANLSGADLSGANLSGANLYGANLSGADLSGANLSGANLSGANLPRADLSGANLSGANLSRANLSGANLYGADLFGASLGNEEILVGGRPIFQVGPIGSRCAYFVAFLTDKGLRLRTGCFFGSRQEFEEKLADEHADNKHAVEYRAALTLVDAHFAAWGIDHKTADSL